MYDIQQALSVQDRFDSKSGIHLNVVNGYSFKGGKLCFLFELINTDELKVDRYITSYYRV